MEKKETLNRWSEYVGDLLEDDRCKKPKIEKNIEGPTLLKEDVEAAITKMKNGKPQAFDKVRHVELFRMIEKLDIDGKYLRVIRNLYWDQTASVRIEGEHSDFKRIKRGVRQRCVMSHDIFNLYSEIILRNLDSISGLKINGENLNLRYADDTVLMAESGEQLQKLLDTVVLESERLGLSLNVKKTECMVISKKSSNPKCNLVRKGEHIKQVSKFKYLGYLIPSDGRCTSEIIKIAMAKNDTNTGK
ncbi:retrovirus-related pol polyprotein line-1 [Plakobranchus ocellatus]|uniref:Retrovirus-related pol polyprotein line-1 n=1 Tax=Plakobranchus ocellatus TaxID=259542 RepID=A0AAV3XVJ7_9GAST|nr:retrovirus-related pol polyprotein line-1 [Plakobranchus ocellatus]